MFVIPPLASQESYYNDIAQNAWITSQKNNRDQCESLKSEDKTMVVNCKISMENGSDCLIFLNYRYFKSILYCFVQETDPSQQSLVTLK